MSASVTPLKFAPPDVPEDQARAGYYALLARLYYAGPDAGLLAAIAEAGQIVTEGSQSALASAWTALAAAARAMDAEAARLEYEALFVGTGKAEVTPYASFYLAETGRERILVKLRGELAALGLERARSSHEPEDHVAGLFDAMRHLISRGSDDAAPQQQRSFFERYLAGAFGPLCIAIGRNEKANFYKHVAHFTEAFLRVESEALKVF
ncbi:MAG TPA: molecular chaperone TorD family protein [Burkholderiales bacterium]|nr:molecular chaperone TorD family protein [Burkholderiales bacterium]